MPSSRAIYYLSALSNFSSLSDLSDLSDLTTCDLSLFSKANIFRPGVVRTADFFCP